MKKTGPIIIIPSWMLFLLLFASAALCSGIEAVNPHWTGRHCRECHTSDNRTLREKGNVIAVCNRCHDDKTAPMESHPFGMKPPLDIKEKIPGPWPLQKDRVTCTTCHDVLIQMYDNPAERETDSAFVRGGPYESLSTFCFICHDPEAFQKTNPHRSQRDESGAVNKRVCVICHRSVPDPERVQSTTDVAFIADRTELCLNCHSDKRTAHPAREKHLLTISRERFEAVEQKAAEAGVALPFFKNTISCGTCHNPHEPGVIARTAAAAGAGEKHLLRLPAGSALCIVCHPDKVLPELHANIPETDVLKAPPQPLIPHQPWRENKCKSCHSITPQKTGRPDAPGLCMKKGCHETVMYDNPHLHDISVLNNCYFCHESHTAHYGKLLRSNEERVCYTCHPLVPDTVKEDNISITGEDHDRIAAYGVLAGAAQVQGCSFCHEAAHASYVSAMRTGSCADCHIHITRIVQRYAQSDVHASPSQDRCSQCHDPHAETYPYQLKQPLRLYREK